MTASIAGRIWVTKKLKTMKTPEKPAPILIEARSASFGLIRAARARTSMNTGRMT